MHLKISHICMNQYVPNLYKFLKAKAGLERVSKFEV